MDMEEVYLRQITEHLKRLNELQETNNDLLNEKIEQLLGQIQEADEKNKSKLQNKIDCLKLLLN